MRIIFAGTPTNAARTLEALLKAGLNVVGVLTREDAAVGRKKTLTASPVADLATEQGLELRKANRMTDSISEWISGLGPELGVIVAYGSILRKPVLEIPKAGWINLHYSLLPNFPGAAPVQHAIANGESTTGVTIFRLDEGIDTGAILASRSHQIDPNQNSGSLLAELTVVGAELLVETCQNLELAIAGAREQSVPSGVKVAGKLGRDDARIDFAQPAGKVHNLVRAMNPEPVAWFEIGKNSVRVLETKVLDSPGLAVGEARLIEGQLFVGCLSGAVELVSVQPAGKNPMSGTDWFRGLRQESIKI